MRQSFASCPRWAVTQRVQEKATRAGLVCRELCNSSLEAEWQEVVCCAGRVAAATQPL